MTLATLNHAADSIDATATSVLLALASPVVVVSPSQHIRFVNDAAEQFFSISEDQLRNKRLTDIVSFDSPLVSLVDQVQARGAAVVDHAAELTGIGTGPRLVQVQAAPIGDASGAVVLLITPVSVAAQLSTDASRTSVARSIGAMSALLAHEIKNPLAGIRGAAQLLEPGLNPEDQKLARLIRDECDRVCNLVDRMDAIADPSLTRESVNIHAVMDRVLQLAKAGFAAHVDLRTEYDPSLPPAFGDHDQLVQVFLNLVKNAAAALPREGGRISITTRYQHDYRLSGRQRGHIPLQVSVRDNGSGIPEEVRPYVFDPFVTTKSGGTGLGLALVAKVVSEHGGTVNFESNSYGTTFHVRLPITEGAAGGRSAVGS